MQSLWSYGQSSFITGKVFSEVTKSVLYNAKLILKKDHKYHSKTLTDHVGNYCFGNLAEGHYSIWVLQEGYCELEISQIQLLESTSIQLDLGLMEQAPNSSTKDRDKLYKIYQAPIQIEFEQSKMAYQNFKNEIHILNEVYHGHEIKIAPAQRPPSPIEQNRSTHYHESLKALEKNHSLLPSRW